LIYFDTSALVRAFRMRLAPAGVTRSHSVAEFYSTLTGRGITVETPEGKREQWVLSRRMRPALFAGLLPICDGMT